MMPDFLLTSILPYFITIGVVASIVASLALVARVFMNRKDKGRILGRIEKIETSIRSDASSLNFQLMQARTDLEPERAKVVVLDLSGIAEDLQKRTDEVHKILDELRSEQKKDDNLEYKKKIVRLEIAVGQTETKIQAVINSIAQEKNKLPTLETSNAGGAG